VENQKCVVDRTLNRHRWMDRVYSGVLGE